MTEAEAIDAVRQGKLVECSTEEYPDIRRALQKQAGVWVDQQQHVYAQIALNEVKRLDREHDFTFE